MRAISQLKKNKVKQGATKNLILCKLKKRKTFDNVFSQNYQQINQAMFDICHIFRKLKNNLLKANRQKITQLKQEQGQIKYAWKVLIDLVNDCSLEQYETSLKGDNQLMIKDYTTIRKEVVESIVNEIINQRVAVDIEIEECLKQGIQLSNIEVIDIKSRQ